ncbi:MAG: GldG family protein [Clostridia bacterium]|nr:GldG family protein [Clostridia bacterium]
MNKKRNYMATAGAVTCLIIAVIIVVNILFGVLGTKVNLKLDMTKDKLLSFSEPTIETLNNLQTDVNVYSLIPEAADGDLVNQLREIVEKYAKMSSKINYKVVDTEKNPEFVQKYASVGEGINQYSIIFETDKRFKVVDLNDALGFDSSGQSVQYISAEKLFTSALLYVTNEKTIKIGVAEGHGEMASAAYFEAILTDEGYEVESINLMTSDIPEDMNSIIISTPEKDYDPVEIDKIDAFLDKGNSLQVLMPPTGTAFPKLESYLAEWGIEFQPGYVAETDKNHYYQTQVYLIPEMVNSDVTSGLINGGMMLLFPGSRAIKPNTNQYVTEQVLLTTTDKAIVKTNINAELTEGEITAGEGDLVEKSNLASIVTKQVGDELEAKIFVSGGINFIQQTLLESNFANKDFYMNTIASLTDNDANIFIRAKDISTPMITVTALMGIIYGAVTVIIIPLALLIAGLVIWLRRRHL